MVHSMQFSCKIKIKWCQSITVLFLNFGHIKMPYSRYFQAVPTHMLTNTNKIYSYGYHNQCTISDFIIDIQSTQ